MNTVSEFLNDLKLVVIHFVTNHLGRISAHTLGWISIVVLNMAPVPTLLSVLLGKSDKLPPVDLMVMLWTGLITVFFKNLIERDILYIATICLGFFCQTVLMSLILFK
jgi:hypothetical protein